MILRQLCRGEVSPQEDVLLFGGEGAGDLRPEFVPKLNWLLATDFMPGYTGTVRAAAGSNAAAEIAACGACILHREGGTLCFT